MRSKVELKVVLGMLFLLGMFVYGTAVSFAASIVGNQDSTTCSIVSGWVCMPTEPDRVLDVHMYKNKSFYDGGTIIGSATANQTREAAVGAMCGGNSMHGFSFSVPQGVLKQGDQVFVHAIDGGANPLILNSGKTVTSCTATPTAQSCQRCSNNNGCEMTTFQSTDGCNFPIGEVTRVTDTLNCDPVAGGNNARCSVSPTAMPAQAQSCRRCSNINGCEMTAFQSTDGCNFPIGEVTRTTDTVSCGPIAGGNNDRCPAVPSATPIPQCTVPVTSGSFTLPVTVAEAGSYTVWVRMMSSGSSSNAFYLKGPRDCYVVMGDADSIQPNVWQWVNYKDGQPSRVVKTQLVSGLNYIQIAAKEPRVKIDKVLLLSTECIPVGTGANCSTTMYPTTAPTAKPTLAPASLPSAVPSPTQILPRPSTPPLIPSPSVLPTTTPVSASHTIVIYAAGSSALSIYPTMTLSINNQLVKTWQNISSQPDKKPYQAYTFQTNQSLTGAKIQVGFSNDYYAPFQDRNLFVDRIEVDGQSYETESPSVLSTSCSEGIKLSEALYCNGYVEYTLPLQPGTAQSVITIYAAGDAADAVYPTMQLQLDGEPVYSWVAINADPARKPYKAYTYIANRTVNPVEVRVAFTNDAVINGHDRNLFIDKMIMDGITYEAESPQTFTTSCSQGYKKQEALYCNGYFRFK